jgi:hypothetical protein
MEAPKTRVQVSKYFQSGEITPPFNSILFVNEGTSTVILNGLQILPGQSYADNGTTNEENFTLYRYRFVAPGVNRLLVAVKYLVNGL